MLVNNIITINITGVLDFRYYQSNIILQSISSFESLVHANSVFIRVFLNLLLGLATCRHRSYGERPGTERDVRPGSEGGPGGKGHPEQTVQEDVGVQKETAQLPDERGKKLPSYQMREVRNGLVTR